MPKERIDVLEALQEWVKEAFGDAANPKAERYRMALWYARRQYRLDTDAADE